METKTITLNFQEALALITGRAVVPGNIGAHIDILREIDPNFDHPDGAKEIVGTPAVFGHEKQVVIARTQAALTLAREYLCEQHPQFEKISTNDIAELDQLLKAMPSPPRGIPKVRPPFPGHGGSAETKTPETPPSQATHIWCQRMQGRYNLPKQVSFTIPVFT